MFVKIGNDGAKNGHLFRINLDRVIRVGRGQTRNVEGGYTTFTYVATDDPKMRTLYIQDPEGLAFLRWLDGMSEHIYVDDRGDTYYRSAEFADYWKLESDDAARGRNGEAEGMARGGEAESGTGESF